MTRQMNQSVGAPVGAGMYIFNGYIGQYPDEIWDQDQFTFSKLTSADYLTLNYCSEDWGTYFENTGASEAGSLEDADTPEKFELFPPYPNPFNQLLTLEFTLPSETEIELAVYDIQGREINSLLHGYQSLGRHSVIWDASGQGSGMFFVRLTVDGGQSFVSKVVLMK